MRHKFATMRQGAHASDAAIEKGVVHYAGCGLIGADTLCGHTDRTDFDWHDTNKRVNCAGCLAVRNHVIGRSVNIQERG